MYDSKVLTQYVVAVKKANSVLRIITNGTENKVANTGIPAVSAGVPFPTPVEMETEYRGTLYN